MVVVPAPLALAQLTSSNYQIDSYSIGETEAVATSSNYQVDYGNDGTFVYDEPEGGGIVTGSGGGGGDDDPDPDPDPTPDPEPDPDPDPTPDPNPVPADPPPTTDDGVGEDTTDPDDDNAGDGGDGNGSSGINFDPEPEVEIEIPVNYDLPEVDRSSVNNSLTQRIIDGIKIRQHEVVESLLSVTPEVVLEIFEPAVKSVNSAADSAPVEAATMTGGFLIALLGFLRAPFSVTGIARVFAHAVTNLLGLFAFGKRRRPWGTVYDSVSKYPLDPAIVELFDAEGNSVSTAITDFDGRYGFLVPKGIYTMVAKKSNYKFPSTRKTLTGNDVIYNNLYYGEPIMIDGTVARDIPLDPVDVDWNQIEKKRLNKTRFIHRFDPVIVFLLSALFYLGVVLAVWQVMVDPSGLSFVLLGLYLLLLAVRLYNRGPLLYGTVLRGKVPLPYSVVRIFSGEAEIANKVTDESGRYVAIVPPGTYKVTVDERVDQDSYETVHNSIEKAKKGIINSKLSV